MRPSFHRLRTSRRSPQDPLSRNLLDRRCETAVVDIRRAAQGRLGRRASDALRRLNDRHPWSHNDAFHEWIITRLPSRRVEALDVGCGRGQLLSVLSEHFTHVHGTDIDASMRRVSMARCAGLTNVTVGAERLEEAAGGADLVTMVAVLHHLDLAGALQQVRRLLNPGGRFLCVGLARPESTVDRLWDAASVLTNPIIGFVRHPWVATQPSAAAPFPVKDPKLAFAQIRVVVDEELPGAKMRRHLGFRHTIEWTKP